VTLIVRYRDEAGKVGVGVQDDDHLVHALTVDSLGALLRLPLTAIRERVQESLASDPLPGNGFGGGLTRLAPVDARTEVWASGVTYLRSQEARMEESAVADVYARVYDARRPELFLKAVAWRVVGDGDPIGIRADSELDVPEPELALVVNAAAEIVGVSICNDVSSRSIEGENPLYLPQAKIYAGSCALGPGIRPSWELDTGVGSTDLEITMDVVRSAAVAFTGTTRTSTMRRTFDDLVEHLYRGDHFPDGAVLSTGTGVVPDMSFTLEDGDVVRIVIEGIGTLTNHVVVGKAPFEP
jgi:2-dehydro-3-deoxy-D-arabinonate dehydratase